MFSSPTAANGAATYPLHSTPVASSTVRLRRRIAEAPALALDHAELGGELMPSAQQLVSEAVAINHAGVNARATLDRYRDHLDHFIAYLASAHAETPLTAKRRHVVLFMTHLGRSGGCEPDELRLPCTWCRQRGYPDGRNTSGWSASYRKSYLSAIRFLYRHCQCEEDLPDADPSQSLTSPKIVRKRGYTPNADEVQALLNAPGGPKDRLLAHWMWYTPSRRATFSDAVWRDVDLDAGVWHLTGKGGKQEEFALHPALVREFRVYRRWQLVEAQRNSQIRDALGDPETAFVLLTRTGRQTRPESIGKMLKWRARRAGVGVVAAKGKWDSPGGETSLLHPHSMRRAWAEHALNHPTDPVSIDVVQEVLHHADISTTRRHYARTKPERARQALLTMRL